MTLHALFGTFLGLPGPRIVFESPLDGMRIEEQRVSLFLLELPHGTDVVISSHNGSSGAAVPQEVFPTLLSLSYYQQEPDQAHFSRAQIIANSSAQQDLI